MNRRNNLNNCYNSLERVVAANETERCALWENFGGFILFPRFSLVVNWRDTLFGAMLCMIFHVWIMITFAMFRIYWTSRKYKIDSRFSQQFWSLAVWYFGVYCYFFNPTYSVNCLRERDFLIKSCDDVFVYNLFHLILPRMGFLVLHEVFKVLIIVL